MCFQSTDDESFGCLLILFYFILATLSDSLWMVTAAMKLEDACSLEEKL